MRAAQITDYGGPEVMAITDDAVQPVAKEGQVLVEVYAASVNPFDIAVREGKARNWAELKLPATLGGDVSGIVAEVGEGAEGFIKGQAVYGQANALSGEGSHAEYTPVKATQLATKPNSIDFATAAALPLVSVSAYQALVDHMNLQSGQKILIHGGAGGIGSMAIQLAKHLGAYVATTASTTDSDFVKGLGADEVIDYKTQDFSTILKDYDAVFDTIGGETNQKSYTVLKAGGSLVSMVAPQDEELVSQHKIEYTQQGTQTTSERLNAIAALIDDGTLRPIIDKVFPLEQIADAFEHLKNDSPRGKVVIQIKS